MPRKMKTMDEQFKQHGAFSWCELLTSDVNAAKEFYTKLFGWETEEMPMPVGGKILMPPQDIPDVGRLCVIQDPQGAVINAIAYLKR